MLNREIRKNECLEKLEEFPPQIFLWGAYYISYEKRLCKIKYGFQFQMMIMALDLALHISSTLDFSPVQVLVQDLLLISFLKVMTFLEDVTRCYVHWIYVKKENIRLFNWLFFFNYFLLWHFGPDKSLE